MKRLALALFLGATLGFALPASAQVTVDSTGGCHTIAGLQITCGNGLLGQPGGNGNPLLGTATLGAYSLSSLSGTMAAGLAAASPVFSMRFAPVVTTNVLVCRKISIAAGDLVGFTAGFVTFQLFAARAFSVNDTGGAASTLTTNNAKLRTSFAQVASTDIADFRTSTTATLTAGTRTLDATPLATIGTSVAATAGAPIVGLTDLFNAVNPGQEPIVLANNEGLVLQATVPATGTWQFSVNAICDEVPAY